MNANAIINDDMTLEEKLSAIDEELKKAQEHADEEANKNVNFVSTVDPASLTIF